VPGPSILILTLPLAIVIRCGVVAREEAYLERRFGDAYRGYKARMRAVTPGSNQVVAGESARLD